MSFTIEIIDELVKVERDKTCCKKAFLLGLFLGGEVISDNSVSIELKTEESARLAEAILKKQFSATPSVEKITRAGRKMLRVSADSRAVSGFLKRIDTDVDVSAKALGEMVGFRCGECQKSFLAGAFVAIGTTTDPQKRYSLEFGVKVKSRAEWLSAFLCEQELFPSNIDRGSRIGLYYRGNQNVMDVLAYMGTFQAYYKVLNIYAAHTIKNNENRATNCVLRNIRQSVDSCRRQIEAIELLRATGKLETLSEELQYTASLRCENDTVSLSELAALHTPPISKSGLNRRLEKLVSLAEKI